MSEYADHGLAEMNVKELCRLIPIARTAFYQSFGSLDEVLLSVEDDLLNGLVEAANKAADWNYAAADFKQYLYVLKEYIDQNWDGI